jgi:hypothetical protein
MILHSSLFSAVVASYQHQNEPVMLNLTWCYVITFDIDDTFPCRGGEANAGSASCTLVLAHEDVSGWSQLSNSNLYLSELVTFFLGYLN